eukprot:scaffold79608_cov57-Phaeocystis_antarctica.AAC.1
MRNRRVWDVQGPFCNQNCEYREIRNWNCAISRPWASLDLHRELRNEKCEASQIRDRGGNLNSETRIEKSVPRNLWPLLQTLLRETGNLQSSEFCRACFGICSPEFEMCVWNLGLEFFAKINELTISNNFAVARNNIR